MPSPLENLDQSAALVLSAVDLRTLILKLRWIGLEQEAMRLHDRLRRMAPDQCAGLWPMETD